jgi:sugar lactone lactonase YvrE
VVTLTRLLLVLAGAAALLAAVSAQGAQSAFPARIALPNGFQPEGIAAAGQQFYVGSIPTGAVYRGSLRSGAGAVLVPATTDRSAIGLKVDRGRIFVAGGSTGMAFVYDARTGADIASFTLATGGGTFVNDVVVTKSAAWFTDSFRPVLYKVPLAANGRPGAQAGVKTVALSGDYDHQQGSFNVNGIDATPNGKTLVIVQSSTGKLFTVVPTTGFAKEIALGGGATATNGDGILLAGRTLYVVQNSDNRVAKFLLTPNLRSGRLVRTITSPQLDVPTTVAKHGNRLYVVNARFGTAPTPTTPYWVTKLPA